MKFGKVLTYKDIEEAKKLIEKKVVCSDSFQGIVDYPELGIITILKDIKSQFTFLFKTSKGNFQFIREVIEEPELIADEAECPECDGGQRVEEFNPWHIGTPIEKGWYLCEYYVNEISKEFNVRYFDPDNDWFVKVWSWEKAKKNFRMIRWQRYYEPNKETSK